MKKELTEVQKERRMKQCAKGQKENILYCFGNRTIFVEEIPSEDLPLDAYSHLFPWFIVTTTKGRIKIGYNDNGINIDWSDSIIKTESTELFPYENVHKYEKTIANWHYEHVKKYIDKLLSKRTH